MSDVSVAVADSPSTSGAHWANRDNENIYRRSGTPFRRPNAINSFPEDGNDGEVDPASWWGETDAARQQPVWPDQSAVPGMSDTSERAIPAFREAGPPGGTFFGADEADDAGEFDDRLEETLPPRPARPAPEFGPAPPASTSRVSFGVTSDPIGGYRPGYGPPAGAPTTPGSPAPAGWPPSDGWQSSSAAPTSPAARSGRLPEAATPGLTAPEFMVPAGRPISPASPPPRSKPLVPPVTGHTGEIFNGPAREILSHRAVRQNTGGHKALKAPTPPRGLPVTAPAAPARRGRGATVAALVLGSVVLLGSAAGGVAYFSGDGRGVDKVVELGAGAVQHGRTATAPLGGRTTAGFEMVAASNKMTVKTQNLGADLFRITTADDSGMVPTPVVTAGRVELHLTPQGAGTSGDVTILLSSKVRWALQFTGGSDEQLIDMTGGAVSGVTLVGGARRVELTLPKPSGTVPVLVTGALQELSVRSTTSVPVRVSVEAGAKTVTAGTRTLKDVGPGSTLTPKDWQVKDRYDVDAKSWVTLLSVDARS
jgi:hypothetical protein